MTSTKAVATAVQIAGQSGGRVKVLHALDELAYAVALEYAGNVMRAARDEALKMLADAQAIAKAAGVEVETELYEKAGQRLGDSVAQVARTWEADLVVVGTHGRRGIGRVVLGSGAEQIIRHADVPVLVIRGRD